MGRPEKPLISRERATKAALDVIDVQGLSELSLAMVARKLGVRAPSLYYHFKDKAELLSEVALCILNDVEVSLAKNQDWEEAVIQLCKATRRSILRHPNAAPLLLEFFPRHILVGAYNYWAKQCPYPPEFRLVILEGLEKLTYGSALFAASARAQSKPSMPEFNVEKYSELAMAVRANPYDDEGLFVETIQAYLRGFHKFVKTDKKGRDAST